MLNSDQAASALLLEEARQIYGGAHLEVIATGDSFVADPAKGRQLRRQPRFRQQARHRCLHPCGRRLRF